MIISISPPKIFRPGIRSRPWLVVFSVTGATVLPTYLNGALTVALPTIGARIGLSPAQWAWPLTVLSLVNGAFLLISGGLADAFGRRLMFLAGIVWLMIFSLALAFVKESTPFIATSAILGFGPAMLAPAGTGILGESLPNGKFRNGAFAAMGAGQPSGFVIGLFLGGLLGNQFHVLYIVSAVASLLFGFVAWTCLPLDGEKLQLQYSRSIGSTSSSRENLAILTGREQDEDGIPRRAAPLAAFDWFGAILCTSGIILFTLGIAFAGTERKGWSSIPVVSMLPVGASLLLSFFLWELHVQRQSTVDQGSTLRAPLIPPGIWSAPNFTALLATIFFSWLSFNTLTYYCTLYFQEVQHTKPLKVSIYYLPMIFVGLSLNILGGIVVDKIDAFWLIILGLSGSLVSCLIYIFMNPNWSYAKGMLWVLITIVSPDIFFPAVQLFACHTVGPRRSALAGSLFNVTVRLASSIGLAATTAVATYTSNKHSNLSKSDAALAGYRAAAWLCMACTTLSLIVAPLALRKLGIVGKLTAQSSSNRQQDEPVQATSNVETIALQTINRENQSQMASDNFPDVIAPIEKAHNRGIVMRVDGRSGNENVR